MLPLDVLAGQFTMATGLMAGSFELPYHPLMVALYIFLLASYVGFYVIKRHIDEIIACPLRLAIPYSAAGRSLAPGADLEYNTAC